MHPEIGKINIILVLAFCVRWLSLANGVKRPTGNVDAAAGMYALHELS